MKNKNGIGLITLIIVIVAILVIGGVSAFFIIKNSDKNNQESVAQNNGSKNNNESNISTNVIYKDSSRDIKSNYTFDEATSKFAFKEYETTLIFQQKDNVKLSSISLGKFSTVSFCYKKDDSTYFTFQFEESGSSNVNEFVNNFKNGILGGGKRQLSFENIKILESNNEYVFVSCQESGNVMYKYYFAKQIGNKVFYAYDESLQELNNEEKSHILNGCLELFGTLSIDDTREPYICDKVMNVPVVFSKQIKNYEFIDNIQVINPKTSTANYRYYMKGFVTLYSEDNKRIEVHYDAEPLYNKIEFDTNISSKIKYSNEDNLYGIKDNDITQIFNINKTENINNEKIFNEFLTKFFN